MNTQPIVCEAVLDRHERRGFAELDVEPSRVRGELFCLHLGKAPHAAPDAGRRALFQ